jgi:hypothetical protein
MVPILTTALFGIAHLTWAFLEQGRKRYCDLGHIRAISNSRQHSYAVSTTEIQSRCRWECIGQTIAKSKR